MRICLESAVLTRRLKNLDRSSNSKPWPFSVKQAAATAGDPYFHDVLYSTLIDVGASRQLLGLDARSAHLEPFLRRASGLANAQAGGMLGALQPEQVKTESLQMITCHLTRFT